MKRLALAAIVLLAACASNGAATGAPTSDDVAAALLREMNAASAEQRTEGASIANQVAVRDLACAPAADGCFQCGYNLHASTVSLAEDGSRFVADRSEPRVDMVCNVSGAWTATPMSQIGS